MSPLLIISIILITAATSFVSGILGMAGGLVLMGVLIWLLPVQEAMALHAIAQMASNGWRGLLWIGHVRWRAVASYVGGCLIALLAWSMILYVPSRAVALLMLGIVPFLVRALPEGLAPDPERPADGAVYGAACMSLMLMTGVAGPLLDSYFLGGNLGRREIVATKAICQIFGHAAKLVYFGALVAGAATIEPWLAGAVIVASMIGTLAARPVLERLSEARYRSLAAGVVTAIACAYLVQGGWLMAAQAQ